MPDEEPVEMRIPLDEPHVGIDGALEHPLRLLQLGGQRRLHRAEQIGPEPLSDRSDQPIPIPEVPVEDRTRDPTCPGQLPQGDRKRDGRGESVAISVNTSGERTNTKKTKY